MKAKDYLITWLWTSLLMYFLYDVVWVLADHEEFNRLLEEGCTILWIDLCYCFLFSIYNLGFGTLLLKSRLLRLFPKKKIPILSAIFSVSQYLSGFSCRESYRRAVCGYFRSRSLGKCLPDGTDIIYSGTDRSCGVLL